MGASTPATNRTVQSIGIFCPQQIIQRSNVEFASMYLSRMRETFKHDQPQIYNSFIDIMKDFKAQLINLPRVISEVRHLFHNYPELISGFNVFLPGGYKIDMSSYAQVQPYSTDGSRLEEGPVYPQQITEKNIRSSTLPIAIPRQGTEDFYQQVFHRSVVEYRPSYHPNENEHLKMISHNHPPNFY